MRLKLASFRYLKSDSIGDGHLLQTYVNGRMIERMNEIKMKCFYAANIRIDRIV